MICVTLFCMLCGQCVSQKTHSHHEPCVTSAKCKNVWQNLIPLASGHCLGRTDHTAGPKHQLNQSLSSWESSEVKSNQFCHFDKNPGDWESFLRHTSSYYSGMASQWSWLAYNNIINPINMNLFVPRFWCCQIKEACLNLGLNSIRTWIISSFWFDVTNDMPLPLCYLHRKQSYKFIMASPTQW